VPCDSRITVTCNLGANVDTGLLLEALKKLKAAPVRQADGSITFQLGETWKSTGTFKGGKLTLNLSGWARQDDLVNQVKQAYSYQVVMSALRKVGGSSSVDAKDPSVIHVKLVERS
jgi:hypothetical protein